MFHNSSLRGNEVYPILQGPEVYIDEPDVNFGLVRFGNTTSTHLTLHNDSQMPATYEIKEKLPANCNQV